MDILEDFEFRGLLNQCTDLQGLQKRLNEGSLTLYAGFDPTADSLHIGSLMPIITLMRFQKYGHKPLALVGGGTGLIGDPSGKTNERALNTSETVNEWSQKLERQLMKFLDFSCANAAEAVNNHDWLKNLNVISFLRDVGKHFSVNYMLAKDSVNGRLENGISFTEFSYMLLQAYDFAALLSAKNCVLQVGGSDQWGNITAGLEYIRKTQNREAFGLTIPLVTKADGTKFGKTEKGAVWLDADKTSPYDFYQFWLNVDDKDAVKFLKYFTFLSREQIDELERQTAENPSERKAQKALAEDVTRLVHGDTGLESAKKVTNVFFTGSFSELSAEELQNAFQSFEILRILDGSPLVEILASAGLVSSRREARQFIESGAISINGEKRLDAAHVLRAEDALHQKFFVIKRGKKHYAMAEILHV